MNQVERFRLLRTCFSVGGVIFAAIHNDLPWIMWHMSFETFCKCYLDEK